MRHHCLNSTSLSFSAYPSHNHAHRPTGQRDLSEHATCFAQQALWPLYRCVIRLIRPQITP
jgi:hypothetical protein